MKLEEPPLWMKLLCIILGGIIYFLIFHGIILIVKGENLSKGPSGPTEMAIIQENSLVGQLNPYTVITYKTCECESNWRQWVVGQAGEIGVCQYLPATWNRMSSEYHEETGIELDIHSEKDQWVLTLWAIEKGYGNEWTCYRRLKGR